MVLRTPNTVLQVGLIVMLALTFVLWSKFNKRLVAVLSKKNEPQVLTHATSNHRRRSRTSAERNRAAGGLDFSE